MTVVLFASLGVLSSPFGCFWKGQKGLKGRKGPGFQDEGTRIDFKEQPGGEAEGRIRVLPLH